MAAFYIYEVDAYAPSVTLADLQDNPDKVIVGYGNASPTFMSKSAGDKIAEAIKFCRAAKVSVVPGSDDADRLIVAYDGADGFWSVAFADLASDVAP